MEEGLPVLRSGRRNTHRSITAVNTLHLHQGTLLILLVREANKSVTAGLAGLLVGHDLGALARGEAGLEQGNQDELVHFVAEVTNKDGELGASSIATVD